MLNCNLLQIQNCPYENQRWVTLVVFYAYIYIYIYHLFGCVGGADWKESDNGCGWNWWPVEKDDYLEINYDAKELLVIQTSVQKIDENTAMFMHK